MLLLDGHSSHYEPDTIRLAAEEEVIILCLPPHTTHVSQPLDVSFFRPLKVYWSEGCHMYMQENPGRVVTKYQFSSLFSVAWYKAIKPENLISGFRKTGICPFDSSAITVPDLVTVPDPVTVVDEPEGEKSSDDACDENSVCEREELRPASVCVETVDGLSTPPMVFTQEQIQIFETRYENGYVATRRCWKCLQIEGVLLLENA